jgi:hypothetical protein
VRSRRLSPAERAKLLHRLDPHKSRLPLLHNASGWILAATEGDWRALELWVGIQFILGYAWVRGNLNDRDAVTLMLPLRGNVVFRSPQLPPAAPANLSEAA